MAAYAAGDRRAFEDLFARLAPPVHSFFYRSFGSSAVADDLLQTTFLKVHRARATYQPDRPLRAWLFTIAARVRLDELRRRKGDAVAVDDDALEAAAHAPAAVSSASTPATAEQRLDQEAVAVRVREALERLPEAQRVVVHLNRYEGMTFGEIAKVLGTSEGAIKLRAFRAYEKLRQELGGLLEGAAP